jgi:hypothetical protein
MRSFLFAAATLAAAYFIGSGGASAAPVSGQGFGKADQSSYVTKVAEGCGRGWHRNRWGRCVP